MTSHFKGCKEEKSQRTYDNRFIFTDSTFSPNKRPLRLVGFSFSGRVCKNLGDYFNGP